MAAYNTFSSVAPNQPDTPRKGDELRIKPKAPRLNADVQVVQKTLVVLPNEGPTQIAKRLEKLLGGVPVSWADVVQQNRAYFKNVVDIGNINSRDFRKNGDLKPGMVIRYQAIVLTPPLPANDISQTPFIVVDPSSGEHYALAFEGNLKACGAVEIIFGVERENFEAYIGLGVEVSVEGGFFLNKSGFHSTDSISPKFAIFLEGEAGFDFGPINWGIGATGEIDLSTGNFTFSMDRSLDWEGKDVLEKPGSKKNPKKPSASLVPAISFEYFAFEYDAKENKTKIGVTITASREFEGIFPLGNPLVKVKLRIGAGGSANFYVELPGDQRHLKPRKDYGVEQQIQPVLMSTPTF